MLRPQREHYRVIARRRLQLKVESDTEALAKGEAPGPVNPGAKGGVHDKLHAARLIKEAFEHHICVCRHESEGIARSPQVVDDLHRAEVIEAAFVLQTLAEALRFVEARFDITAQAAYFLRKLDGPAGCFADPERNRWRSAVGVFDPHLAGTDTLDPP